MNRRATVLLLWLALLALMGAVGVEQGAALTIAVARQLSTQVKQPMQAPPSRTAMPPPSSRARTGKSTSSPLCGQSSMQSPQETHLSPMSLISNIRPPNACRRARTG